MEIAWRSHGHHWATLFSFSVAQMSEKTLLAPVSDDERRGVAKAEGQTLGTRILHYLLLALVFASGIAFASRL